MPPTITLHHRQDRAQHPDPPPPRPARRRPSASPHHRVRRRLPTASAPRRAQHRLARPPSPKMPLPRHRQEPALAAAARRSSQPPTPHQPRTAPQRHPLGHHLTPTTPKTHRRHRRTSPGSSRRRCHTPNHDTHVMPSEVVDVVGGCGCDGGVVPVEIAGVDPVLKAAATNFAVSYALSVPTMCWRVR